MSKRKNIFRKRTASAEMKRVAVLSMSREHHATPHRDLLTNLRKSKVKKIKNFKGKILEGDPNPNPDPNPDPNPNQRQNIRRRP